MCIPMLNEPCMRELKWDECRKKHICGLIRLFVSAFFNSLSSMAGDACHVRMYEERIVQRDASLPSSILYVIFT